MVIDKIGRRRAYGALSHGDLDQLTSEWTRNVVRDSDIYGPQYRLARRFALDRLLEEARRCRDCETATCAASCPAPLPP